MKPDSSKALSKTNRADGIPDLYHDKKKKLITNLNIFSIFFYNLHHPSNIIIYFQFKLNKKLIIYHIIKILYHVLCCCGQTSRVRLSHVVASRSFFKPYGEQLVRIFRFQIFFQQHIALVSVRGSQLCKR